MSEPNSYLKFLEKLQTKQSSLKLSPTETKLLHAVAQAEYDGKTLQVKDLLALREVASQATLHGSIKKLVNKKLITKRESQEDARVKFIKLTKSGHKYFEDLGDALNKAIEK